jgi:hypothetical protein
MTCRESFIHWPHLAEGALWCWQGRLLPLARVVNPGPDGEEVRLRVILISLRGV